DCPFLLTCSLTASTSPRSYDRSPCSAHQCRQAQFERCSPPAGTLPSIVELGRIPDPVARGRPQCERSRCVLSRQDAQALRSPQARVGALTPAAPRAPWDARRDCRFCPCEISLVLADNPMFSGRLV